jgi:hypothetical protein
MLRSISLTTDLASRCEALIMALSRMWCSPFALALCAALPREIRNMVYEILIRDLAPEFETAPMVIVSPHHMIPMRPGRERANLLFFCVRCPVECCGVPHFLDWEIVGKQFAAEAAIIFFGLTTFELDHQDDVGPFLTSPLRAFGPAPLEHVRQMTVRLTIKWYEKTSLAYNSTSEMRVLKKRYDRSVESLRPLLDISTPAGFRLKIVIKHCSDAVLDGFKLALPPLVHAMVASGMSVTLASYHSLRASYSIEEFPPFQSN